MDFITTYDGFVKRINEIGKDWEFQDESLNSKLSGQPFAKSALKIFNKSQVMTGFGSALGKLLDFKAIKSVKDISDLVKKLNIKDIDDDLNTLIIKLDKIRSAAKKIGTDQTLFFHCFFRELFDKKSDGYLNISQAIIEAYNQYERKN